MCRSIDRESYTTFCIEQLEPPTVDRAFGMPHHLRLEDRIRSLSKKLVEAEGKEFQRLAIELRTAISEYVERLRARLSRYPSVHSRRFDD